MTNHRVPRLFNDPAPAGRMPSVADMKLPTPRPFDLEARRIIRDTRSEALKIAAKGALDVWRNNIEVSTADAILRNEVEATARQSALAADLHRRNLDDVEALGEVCADQIEESFKREEAEMRRIKDEVDAGADPAYAARRAQARAQNGDRIRAIQDDTTVLFLEMKSENMRSIASLRRTRGGS